MWGELPSLRSPHRNYLRLKPKRGGISHKSTQNGTPLPENQKRDTNVITLYDEIIPRHNVVRVFMDDISVT